MQFYYGYNNYTSQAIHQNTGGESLSTAPQHTAGETHAAQPRAESGRLRGQGEHTSNLQEGSSQQARVPGAGGEDTGDISTWDVSPQPWKRQRGKIAVRMQGRQLCHSPIQSSALRSTVSPHRTVGSGPNSSSEQSCLVKEEPQQGTGVCSAPIHGPGERCPAGSAELSRAGAPQRNQMFSTPLQAPLPKACREVSAPCSPWVRWQETARPQHCPAAEPRAETILLTHQPPTSSSSQ